MTGRTKNDERRLDRAQVLAYRVAAHGLGAPGDAGVVLDTGLQDYPPTRTAWPALRLRDPDARSRAGQLVLAHTMRGAMHLHRSGDLPLLRAALALGAGSDLLPQRAGSFPREIEAAGIGLGEATETVAAAMREITADGVARTKGELSGAVTARVQRRVAPWCEGCGVFHVDDATFRCATLQAGLVIEPESASTFRFVRGPADVDPPPAVDCSRAELVRRFLRAYGPATPAQFGSWLGLTPAAARTWWHLVEPELTMVDAAGKRAGIRTDLLPRIESAPPPAGVRLLPPYDPFTALVDRELAVPDTALRKQVWRAVGVPGVVLVDGEIGGTWRQRSTSKRLTLTVTTFDPLPVTRHREAEADAETIGSGLGAAEVVVDWS